ncbi:MAG TPA: lanthionine synthetase LanC family protein [Kofleriaceae bacterium]|nr:lanthionine synthetase LanC family protein [Kofleriaceae bacterium]
MRSSTLSALDVALEIADRLRHAALRHAGRCTWLGHDNVEMPPGRSLVPTVRSASGELYAGTSGIALFFAELYALAPGDALADLLREAIAHAHATVPAAPGLYTGRAGIGYASVRAGEVLEDPALVREGMHAIANAAAACEATRAFDVMSGHAGIVLAAAALAANHRELVACVVGGTRALLDAGQQRGERWTLPHALLSPGTRCEHALTGLSHGLSGIALALIASHRTTGDGASAAAARGALASEDDWFVPERANWPDLREVAVRTLADVGDRMALVCGETWCHGAPGIAAVRAYAARHLAVRRHLADALRTTAAALDRWEPGFDVCLCHGGLGLAECALVATGRSRAKPMIAMRARATRAIAKIVAAHRPDPWWPSGLPSHGPSPSLMMGMAGVGHQLLRLAAPDRVRSIAILAPD